MLKCIAANQQLMFWMQDISVENDESNVKKINELIENPEGDRSRPTTARADRPASNNDVPPLPTPSNNSALQHLDFASLLSTFGDNNPNSSQLPTPPPNSNTTTNSTNNNNNIPTTTPPLQEIFTPEAILNTGILNDPEVQQELIEHLPEGQKSADQLETAIRSPQFIQAMGSLSHAISDPVNYQSVVTNFSIGTGATDGEVLGDGIGNFLNALNTDCAAATSTGTGEGTTVENKETDKKDDDAANNDGKNSEN